jgi:glycosyltransferase involved in cell wall biosynthesis
MKVIFDCSVPFSFAHGGHQIQIEQTLSALKKIDVSVEPLRWWDASQRGDILHYFGRPPMNLLRLARRKGMRVIIADLLTGQGSRPAWQHNLQRLALTVIGKVVPQTWRATLTWEAYRQADVCIALTHWEAHLFERLYGAPTDRIHVVPNGVEDAFLHSTPQQRGKWLVCTAIITERKRVLELAEAAVDGRTPLWIIGKPYTDSDPYAQRFLQLAKSEPALIRYEGPIDDRLKLAEIYRQARGFVLLSTMESQSISALEAAACECPVLLTDLPWARTVFGQKASYCPLKLSRAGTVGVLQQFYENAPRLPLASRPQSWVEVAGQLKQLYDSLLSTSR